MREGASNWIVPCPALIFPLVLGAIFSQASDCINAVGETHLPGHVAILWSGLVENINRIP
ncbi:hypothetical protein N7532_005040 [Penicillium argentinense]|uniref:Uncharacterized protein n=1 Tax=Penicillium argentinense TaxID=1131581 RepID=A0A9W9K9G1_9EURO|nr:uncharacterized protein N7532_005040 [Penicillium argentinense]KAJ5098039.1 hypothetical protein N7532_005040 [Penicillium argentinense]